MTTGGILPFYLWESTSNLNKNEIFILFDDFLAHTVKNQSFLPEIYGHAALKYINNDQIVNAVAEYKNT